MRFPFLELHSLTDAQRNFEQLEVTADGIVALQALRSLGTKIGQALPGVGVQPAPYIGTAGLALKTISIDFGVTSAVQNGTLETNPISVAHNLGRTPQIVIPVVDGGAYAHVLAARWDSSSATSSLTGNMRVESEVAITFNIGLRWLAIG